jgi:hypothetical protein
MGQEDGHAEQNEITAPAEEQEVLEVRLRINLA